MVETDTPGGSSEQPTWPEGGLSRGLDKHREKVRVPSRFARSSLQCPGFEGSGDGAEGEPLRLGSSLGGLCWLRPCRAGHLIGRRAGQLLLPGRSARSGGREGPANSDISVLKLRIDASRIEFEEWCLRKRTPVSHT